MLAALPRKQYQRLLAGLESVALTFGEILHEPGERIRHVYFPGDSLVSLLTVVEGHLALEVGMVGREVILRDHLEADNGKVYHYLQYGDGKSAFLGNGSHFKNVEVKARMFPGQFLLVERGKLMP